MFKNTELLHVSGLTGPSSGSALMLYKSINCFIMNILKIPRKAHWIGHILCRNCLLEHISEEKVEGRIKVTER
jgi:hypothetical protein